MYRKTLLLPFCLLLNSMELIRFLRCVCQYYWSWLRACRYWWWYAQCRSLTRKSSACLACIKSTQSGKEFQGSNSSYLNHYAIYSKSCECIRSTPFDLIHVLHIGCLLFQRYSWWTCDRWVQEFLDFLRWFLALVCYLYWRRLEPIDVWLCALYWLLRGISTMLLWIRTCFLHHIYHDC